MSTLDAREQRYAYMAAGFGAISSVVLWAHAFDETAGVALAAIGATMAALLAAAARRRSRVLTGVAAVVLSFGPWGTFWLIGLPFLALAAWLAVRAPRRHPPDSTEPRQPVARRRRRRATEGRDGDEAGAMPVARPRPAPPAANKRYTPPQRRS